MPFVTRYQVQDIHGGMWDGFGFTRDEDSAEEYRDEDEAIEAASQSGGEVVQFQRWDRYGDLPIFPSPYNSLQAAE